MDNIVARRLRTQRLVGEPFKSAVEAVGFFGAVQSQDYPAAKWALGQRLRAALDSDIDALFDRGAILRTHIMRPTWHFVLPRDIKWIQGLTSPRVLSSLAGRHRRLELDRNTLARAVELFGEALSGGHFMTRSELGELLTAAGISPEGQRLPHMIAMAEHANVLTSGPRRGKQFTYALLEERAPKARTLDRDEALKELTVRYFGSHGPAQLKDFGWWCGLSMQDIRKGVQLAGRSLARETMAGADHWFGAYEEPAPKIGTVAHLVPNFDEYTVAYRDRTVLIDAKLPFDPSQFAYYRESTPMGGILSNVVTINGRVRGAWSRTLKPGAVLVDFRALTTFNRTEGAAVKRAAESMGRFLERTVKVTGLSAP